MKNQEKFFISQMCSDNNEEKFGEQNAHIKSSIRKINNKNEIPKDVDEL